MAIENHDSASNPLSTDSSPTPDSAPNSQVTGECKSEGSIPPSSSLPPLAAAVAAAAASAVPKSVLPKARAASIDAMRKALAETGKRRGKGRVRTLEGVRARFSWLQAQLEVGAVDSKTAAIMVQCLNGLAGVLGVLKDYEFESRLAAIEASIARKGRGNDA